MPRQRKCENCAKPTPPHNSISLNNRYLCIRCCNETLAGPEFQHIDFDPLPVKDFDGATHTFHFLLRHLGETPYGPIIEEHDTVTGTITRAPRHPPYRTARVSKRRSNPQTHPL